MLYKSHNSEFIFQTIKFAGRVWFLNVYRSPNWNLVNSLKALKRVDNNRLGKLVSRTRKSKLVVFGNPKGSNLFATLDFLY